MRDKPTYPLTLRQTIEAIFVGADTYDRLTCEGEVDEILALMARTNKFDEVSLYSTAIGDLHERSERLNKAYGKIAELRRRIEQLEGQS